MKPSKLLCTVYGLLADGDDHYRYIGQTQVKLNRRLASHWNTARNTDSPAYVYRWLRKCELDGVTITIHAIETECPLDAAEIEWIACFKEMYSDMTNLSVGGDKGALGIKRSEETKAKMRGPKSEATKMKMRKPKSEETRRKMSLAQLGNDKGLGSKNGNAVLVESDISMIRNLCKTHSLSDVGSMFGVTKATVWKVKERLSWKHI